MRGVKPTQINTGVGHRFATLKVPYTVRYNTLRYAPMTWHISHLVSLEIPPGKKTMKCESQSTPKHLTSSILYKECVYSRKTVAYTGINLL